MKRLAILTVGLTLAAGCDSDPKTPSGPSAAGPIVFTAPLTAAAETPPVTGVEAGARGAVTITFNVPRDSSGNPTGGGTATFAIQLNSFPAGTPAILAHIHTGASGVMGPVFVDTTLSPTAPLLMGDSSVNVIMSTDRLTQAQAAAVTNNPAGYYFNVHTPLNPAGAVRGQLTRVQ
jgi:hypothetical protein